jgi:mannose-1-phosphate guanylyltransferase
VKAVVLVGGEGTRLRPLTYTTPKQLLPIVETPMLERVLGHLASHGIDEAVLSLGYRPEAFIDQYPDGTAAGVTLSYAVEPELLDTAGAIGFAARHAGIQETFVVVNGDVLTDGDLTALLAFHSTNGAKATIYLSPVEDPSRFGVVPTDDDGRVIAFVEKPPRDEAPTNLINAGIYVIEPEVLDRIPGDRRVSVERETFPSLAAEGALFAMTDGAYWIDTGTPLAYLQAQSDLLSGRRESPPALGAIRSAGSPGSAGGAWQLGNPEITGDVDSESLVGDGAQVLAGAEVTRSVVGAGAVVEGGAKVSYSVLFPGARVREGAVVDSSIVGKRAVVGSGSSISELSIIDDDVVIAEGEQIVTGRIRAPEAT